MAVDSIGNKAWRLELFYKTSKELRDKTLPFLKEHGIQRLNLTNKVVTAVGAQRNSRAQPCFGRPSGYFSLHYAVMQVSMWRLCITWHSILCRPTGKAISS